MADRKVDKLIRVTASGNSFQSVAAEWHKGQSVRWAPVTAFKTLKHMEADLFPAIGHRLVPEVTPSELLAALASGPGRSGAHPTSASVGSRPAPTGSRHRALKPAECGLRVGFVHVRFRPPPCEVRGPI